MRFRIARVLSVGGVLATATAVTTYSQFVSTAPVSASASSSSSPTAAPVPVSASPVAGSTTQFSYVVGDAATVILDSAGGTLRIVAFAPHPGWFTVRLEQPNATELEIRLESPSDRVRFAADLVNGAIVTELEAGTGPGDSVPGTGPDNSAPGGSVPGTGPDNSAPDGSGPDNSSPRTSSPGNTVPGGDDDGDDDDGDSSGPGSGGDDSGGDPCPAVHRCMVRVG